MFATHRAARRAAGISGGVLASQAVPPPREPVHHADVLTESKDIGPVENHPVPVKPHSDLGFVTTPFESGVRYRWGPEEQDTGGIERDGRPRAVVARRPENRLDLLPGHPLLDPLEVL